MRLLKLLLSLTFLLSFNIYAYSQQVVMGSDGMKVYENGILVTVMDSEGIKRYENGKLVGNVSDNQSQQYDEDETDNSNEEYYQQKILEKNKETQRIKDIAQQQKEQILEQQQLILQKDLEIKKYLIEKENQKQKEYQETVKTQELNKKQDVIKYNIVDLKNKNILEDIERNCIVTKKSGAKQAYKCSDIQQIVIDKNKISTSINIYTQNSVDQTSFLDYIPIGDVQYSYIFYIFLFFVLFLAIL